MDEDHPDDRVDHCHHSFVDRYDRYRTEVLSYLIQALE